MPLHFTIPFTITFPLLKKFGALAIALVLTFAHAPPPAAHADEVLDTAEQLLAERRYDDALNLLRPLSAHHPEAFRVHFLIALAALSAATEIRGDDKESKEEKDALLNEAIRLFHAILVATPNFTRARLELASAFFLKGEDDLAKAQFERALSDKTLPQNVVINIHRYLHTIRARRRWTGYFSFSIAPDSNINNATEDPCIIGNFFCLDEDDLAKSGIGVSVSGGREYQHPITDRLRWRFGVDASRNEYAGSDYDQSFLSVRSGPRFFLSRQTEASLQAFYGVRWIVSSRYSYERGARLDFQHRYSRQLQLNGQIAVRDYSYRESSHANGPVLSTSLSARYRLSPVVELNSGFGYSRSRSHAINSRYQQRWQRAGVSFSLPHGWSLGGSHEWRQAQYEGARFETQGAERADRTRIGRVSVYNRGFNILGFSPSLSVVFERQESNSALYDYDRERLDLRFVRQF